MTNNDFLNYTVRDILGGWERVTCKISVKFYIEKIEIMITQLSRVKNIIGPKGE